MNKLYTLLLFCIITSSIIAQNVGCDGERYIDDVFNSVDITLDVQYGEAPTLAGVIRTLYMDIYEPAGDVLEERPVVILAHGGSFISGDKSEFEPICNELARKGYVAVSISYRLIDFLVFDSIQISEIVVMATHDMKAAVRFLREDVINDNNYKIDPSLIIVGGGSAGGVTASHVAFMDSTDAIPSYIIDHIFDNGGYEGEASENTYLSSEVQGLLNYSGSIGRASFIDENDIPFYSAHDDLDPVVPCGYAATNVVPFPVFTYGSCSMKERADAIGLENTLYLVENSDGHVSYFLDGDTAVAQEVLDQSVDYMVDIICGVTNEQPVIEDDEAETIIDSPVEINVANNDSDSDGELDLTRLRILTNPVNGTAVANQNGTITYTPNNGFTGEISFDYLLCDDGIPFLCNKATVAVTINETITGVFNNAFDQLIDVNIFPNPATDLIQLKMNGLPSNFDLSILTLTGKSVYQKNEYPRANSKC